MQLFYSSLALGLAMSLYLGQGMNESLQPGEALVHSHCMGCHASDVYTRPDRRVASLTQLHSRVDGCTKAVGVNWDTTEVHSVVEFLNQRYYRFQ